MQTEEALRAMDNSVWDANKAMTACKTAADYNQICAGKKAGDPALRSSHALPHHYLGKGPNADGVAAARQRFGQTQGLTNREEARRHIFEAHSLPSDAGRSMEELVAAAIANPRPPREWLYRAVFPGYELRHAEGGMPVLAGHFAVFNQWAEINSIFEGRFMERIAPGAFAKTFAENRTGMRVLFQHGRDPVIGDKPLGPIQELEEDDTGARYEVPLLDTSYNRDLLPALEANLYGASFRFRMMREEWVEEPGKSAHNPAGIPERTLKEAQVPEFGPVTFPAYEGATAGVRSLTDEIVFGRFAADRDRLADLVRYVQATEEQDDNAPSSPDAGGDPTSGPERRVPARSYLVRRTEPWRLTVSPRSRSWKLGT